MKTYNSPAGTRIVAAMVLTPGRVDIDGFDDKGEPVFGFDGTKHFYDDQVPKLRGGKPVFLCEDGDQWTFDQLVEVTEEEETE